jgi:hypothetical protein
MVVRCWLEVWDHDLENRLEAGYVSDEGLLFDQLCSFVPFEDWYSVFLCEPMEYWARTRVYLGPMRFPDINRAKSDVYNMEDWIFDPKKNQQLVIEKRRTPGLRVLPTQGNPYIAVAPAALRQ